MSRHWDIMDFQGANRTVDGLGVVSEQPVLKPGEIYTYNSGVAISNSMGAMRGYYTFLNLRTLENFDVDIPLFELSADFLLS